MLWVIGGSGAIRGRIRSDRLLAEAGELLAVALAVAAAGPAAGPALAFLKLLPGPPNPPFPGLILLCVFDPADEFVAGERSDVEPGVKRDRTPDQRLAQIGRQLVDHTSGDFLDLSCHRTDRNAWAGVDETPVTPAIPRPGPELTRRL